MAFKMGINGFGRIGRLFYRASMKNPDFERRFEIIAVNDITDPRTLAHLLKYDSVHGMLEEEVGFKEESITIGGREIKVFSERDPGNLPWKRLEVDFVLESTGLFRSREAAVKHKVAGADKIVISAPAKDPDVTIVLGVNQKMYDKEKHSLISMASCTTNCLAPMVKVLHDTFGFEKGFMTTCHAYTNDQRILDLTHKDLRRARAAAQSIIPTTTGAAKAIGLVLPELDGKLNGIALRVPVADGSITDLVAELYQSAEVDDINAAFKKAAEGDLKGILQYTEDPIVSADIIGNPHSCIFDGQSTMMMGKKGTFSKTLAWYDNEWGFSNRLVDLFNFMVK